MEDSKSADLLQIKDPKEETAVTELFFANLHQKHHSVSPIAPFQVFPLPFVCSSHRFISQVPLSVSLLSLNEKVQLDSCHHLNQTYQKMFPVAPKSWLLSETLMVLR